VKLLHAGSPTGGSGGRNVAQRNARSSVTSPEGRGARITAEGARITAERVARAGDRRRPVSIEGRHMMHWKTVLVLLVFAQLLAGCIFVPEREGRGHEEHERHDEYRR
jgi:hypothetical protein